MNDKTRNIIVAFLTIFALAATVAIFYLNNQVNTANKKITHVTRIIESPHAKKVLGQGTVVKKGTNGQKVVVAHTPGSHGTTVTHGHTHHTPTTHGGTGGVGGTGGSGGGGGNNTSQGGTGGSGSTTGAVQKTINDTVSGINDTVNNVTNGVNNTLCKTLKTC